MKELTYSSVLIFFLTFLCNSLSCSKEEEKDTNVPGTSTRKRKVKSYFAVYSASNNMKCLCKRIGFKIGCL